MRYLTIGFYKSEERSFSPGEIIDLTEKEAKPLLKQNHIQKIVTATKRQPETRTER